MKHIQQEIAVWAKANFGEQKLHQPVMGVAEEAGELCHAALKAEQGIRGTPEQHLAAMVDALGDIMIYAANVSNILGVDLLEVYADTWNQVKQRDWKKNPKTGTDG